MSDSNCLILGFRFVSYFTGGTFELVEQSFIETALELSAVLAFCYMAMAEPSSGHMWYLSSTLSAQECAEWTGHSGSKGHVLDSCQTYVNLLTKYYSMPRHKPRKAKRSGRRPVCARGGGY
jgi:hypothetical protein